MTPFAWLPEASRPTVIAVSLVASVGMLVLLHLVGRPLKPEPIEYQFAWSNDEAQRILGEWKRGGTAPLAATHLSLDYVLILAYVCLFGVGATVLHDRGVWPTLSLVAAWAALLAGTFDGLENAALLRMLLREGGSTLLAPVATGLAYAKWSLIGVCSVYCALGWFVAR